MYLNINACNLAQVTVVPRFCLVNLLKTSLHVRQRGAQTSGPLNMPPGMRVNDSACMHQVGIVVLSSPSTLWRILCDLFICDCVITPRYTYVSGSVFDV